MKKSLLALAAAAMIGLFAQAGTAQAFLLKDRSPSVTAGQIIVGAGMTGAYWAWPATTTSAIANPMANTSRPSGTA